MGEDEYEILPHQEIVRLRQEVERLKANPITSEASNLVSSISKLNESVSRLVRIFERAEKELAQEYKRSKSDEKLNRMIYQNKEIARGIIAVADLIKSRLSQPLPKPESTPVPASAPTVSPTSPEPEMPILPNEGWTNGEQEPPSPTSFEESAEEEESIVPPPPEKKKIHHWFSK